MSETSRDDARPLKRREPGQTVCDEPGSMDGYCSGHLKVFHMAPPDVLRQAPAGGRVFRCARCGALYAGERIAHLH